MRRYGKWAGEPDGRPEDSQRCVAEVVEDFIVRQCRHKRGYGPDGLFCKQHAKQLASGIKLHVPEED